MGVPVSDLLKKPDSTLDRLPLPPLPNIPPLRMSQHFYLNNVALPLPNLSEEKRSELRVDIDRAIERLTQWENQEQRVPKLQLQQIKQKHRERVSSTEQSRTEIVSTDTTSELFSSPDESDSGEMEGEGEGMDGEREGMEGEGEGMDGEGEEERREIVPIIDSDSDTTSSSPVYITAREEHASTAVTQPEPRRTALSAPVCQYSQSPAITRIGPSLREARITAPATSGSIPFTSETTIDSIGGVVNSSGGLAGASVTGLVGASSTDTGGLAGATEGGQVDTTGGLVGTAPVKRKSGGLQGSGGLVRAAPDTSEESEGATMCNTQTTMLSSVVSPPSHKVLRHLEALEAAIELDLSLSARRKLDFGPEPAKQNEATAKASEEVSGEGAKWAEPTTNSHPPTTSPTEEESPRRNISFYVEVDSPNVTTRRGSSSRINSPRINSPRLKTTPKGTWKHQERGGDVIPSQSPRSSHMSGLVITDRGGEGAGIMSPSMSTAVVASMSPTTAVPQRRVRCDSYKTSDSQVKLTDVSF
eukprot:sb/3463786/